MTGRGHLAGANMRRLLVYVLVGDLCQWRRWLPHLAPELLCRHRSSGITWSHLRPVSLDAPPKSGLGTTRIDVVNRAYRFIHTLFDEEAGAAVLLGLAKQDPLPRWNAPTLKTIPARSD
jgi:hypothetical protein